MCVHKVERFWNNFSQWKIWKKIKILFPIVYNIIWGIWRNLMWQSWNQHWTATKPFPSHNTQSFYFGPLRSDIVIQWAVQIWRGKAHPNSQLRFCCSASSFISSTNLKFKSSYSCCKSELGCSDSSALAFCFAFNSSWIALNLGKKLSKKTL